MALRVKKSNSYFWPVVVEYPVDGGKFLKETFEAEFARLEKAEVKSILEAARDDKTDDSEVVKKVMIGWRGVTDEDGEVTFAPGILAQLQSEFVLFDAAVVEAWMASISGAQRKN